MTGVGTLLGFPEESETHVMDMKNTRLKTLRWPFGVFKEHYKSLIIVLGELEKSDSSRRLTIGEKSEKGKLCLSI